MKIQICQCKGQNKENTGYTDCTEYFRLDGSEVCPACGGSSYREVLFFEIPEARSIDNNRLRELRE